MTIPSTKFTMWESSSPSKFVRKKKRSNPATLEMEIGIITFQGQLTQKVSEKPPSQQNARPSNTCLQSQLCKKHK
jgi:hypothetical protein